MVRFIAFSADLIFKFSPDLRAVTHFSKTLSRRLNVYVLRSPDDCDLPRDYTYSQSHKYLSNHPIVIPALNIGR